MTNEKLLARWESKGGVYWIELRSGTYQYVLDPGVDRYCASYSGNGCGGGLAATNDVEAIVEMQAKVDRGYFQPDANKTPMRRTI